MLVDYIIPKDAKSGSATDAAVPEFMDTMLDLEPDMRTANRGGLAWIDHQCHQRFDQDFVDCTDAAAPAAARRHRLSAPRAGPNWRRGVAWFNSFRDFTASGFFTSEMGVNDLGYQGNTAVPEWTGCPAENYTRLGVAKQRIRRVNTVSTMARPPAGSASDLSAPGFNTRFHIQGWTGVRDGDVRGVWSPNAQNAASAARLARDLGVGDAKAYRSIAEMVADPDIHAIWLCGPNQARDRERRGDLRRGDARQGRAARHRVREAAGAQRGRGETGAQAGGAGRDRARLSREPALLAGRGARPGADLGARRADDRSSLSRSRGRGTFRAAQRLVLAGREAGRRRAERHDVPLDRGRALPAHRARRAALARCGRFRSTGGSRRSSGRGPRT